MIEYNHKGELCTYKDILCQEGICSRCNVAMDNRHKDTINDICESLNVQY